MHYIIVADGFIYYQFPLLHYYDNIRVVNFYFQTLKSLSYNISNT